jgi:hypothetical protein
MVWLWGFLIFFLLYSAGYSVWLVSWFFRKKESGDLLINLGRTSVNKRFFWTGVLQAPLVIVWTWRVFDHVLVEIPQRTSLASLELQISLLVLSLVGAISYLALGLSSLEFRENGICFMFLFLNWQSINSYNWDKSKPTLLIIRFKSRFLLSPVFTKIRSIPIPTKHRDVVSQILDERLPGKKL